MYAYSVEKVKNVANLSTDRILMLKIKDNSLPKDSTGVVDKKLFAGENKLHAVQDAGLWYLRYENGSIPPALRQRFTSFNTLMKIVKTYFAQRNIEVYEVIA